MEKINIICYIMTVQLFGALKSCTFGKIAKMCLINSIV